MTKRAIVLGLVFAVFVGIVGFFNDMILRQSMLFNDYMPICIYGSLLLAVILINPLLRLVLPKHVFTRPELALIVAIVLPVSFISSSSWIRHMPHMMVMPRFYNRTMTGWQKRQLLRRAPSVMFTHVPAKYQGSDILDPDKILAALKSPAQKSLQELLIQVLTDDEKARLNQVQPESEGIAAFLNGLLDRPAASSSAEVGNVVLSQRAKEILSTGPRNTEETRILSRQLMDAAFGADLVVSHQAKEDHVISKFLNGVDKDTEGSTFSKVPWYAWTRPLMFWIPLALSISIAFICLALVVRRQWAEHEHLPFPVVSFANSLMPEDGKMNSLFRKKPFWVAVGFVAVLHLNNYAHAWWPRYTVEIPLSIDFIPFWKLVPIFQKGADWSLYRPHFFFALIGLAYFVASDVSLSVGIAPYVYAIIAGVLINRGINLNEGGDYNSLSLKNFVKSGSYFAMFLVIMYTGRRYYYNTLKSAIWLPVADERVERTETIAIRVFFVAAFIFCAMLWFLGISWYWALFQTFVIVMTFVVVSRMVAETGVIIIHPMIMTAVLLWAFVGVRAVGTQTMLLLMLVGAALEFGCQVGVMPMMLHGLQLTKSRPGRTITWAGIAFSLALVVAMVSAIYFRYDSGGASRNDWGKRVSQVGFNPIVEMENRLEGQGYSLETPTGAKWFKSITVSKAPVVVFIIAALAVLICEWFRLRIPNWPFHPIMFLLAAFWHAKVIAGSFLLGWIIRMLIQRYGGGKAYNSVKPVMLGFIGGEMMVGICIIILSAVYYFSTGEMPPVYSVTPR